MALPQEHPFMKLHARLEEGTAWFLAQVEAYEAQRQEYLILQASLPSRDSQELAADLADLANDLDEFQGHLMRWYDRFEGLLKRVWDDQVQAALDGIDAELQQLGASPEKTRNFVR